ncbi:alpha/beta-hydrolase [Calocera viscosa TUFC12733]|uniref:Alpha/beta-hydrolase n=1 Tax=Calocera viscosa (strain TUFC12733) TaxID=1330018 RepID=A0A167G8U4_CALVF|nr:alpha/beta-hydrolase [Calocera viscosa TUFC12733]
MPFVELANEDVQMFYRTNLPGDEYGGAISSTSPPPKDREPLLLLPGTMIDSTDMTEIFASPLSKRYTLIALDPRSVGQTKNDPHLERDAWTDAVDFVKALDALGIDSVHVLAVGGPSVTAVKRMAILWPERVKSLVLVAISNPDPPDWIRDSWNELVDRYLHAKDVETMEDCVNELYPLSYGEYLGEAKIDEVVSYWESQYYPANGSRFYDWAIPFLLRQRLPIEYTSLIHQPTLILNGASTLVTSPEEAEILQGSLPNSAGGAKLVIIPDAPDQFHYIPQFAGILVDEMINFYRQLPETKARKFLNNEKDSWKRALLELAELRKDESMKDGDPTVAASFSCVAPDIIAVRKSAYERISQEEKGAFSPFGPDGKPLRKLSERRLAEISQGAQHSRSRSDSDLWASGVELEVIESDEETDMPTSTEDLRKTLAKDLVIG